MEPETKGPPLEVIIKQREWLSREKALFQYMILTYYKFDDLHANKAHLSMEYLLPMDIQSARLGHSFLLYKYMYIRKALKAKQALALEYLKVLCETTNRPCELKVSSFS